MYAYPLGRRNKYKLLGIFAPLVRIGEVHFIVLAQVSMLSDEGTWFFKVPNMNYRWCFSSVQLLGTVVFSYQYL